jgi:hypothetical protein
MKFLVMWRVELSRVSGEMMRSVLTMPDHARPLEESGKVIGRYHVVGGHGAGDAPRPVARLQLLALRGVPAGRHGGPAHRVQGRLAPVAVRPRNSWNG